MCICVCAFTHIKWTKRTEIKDSKQLVAQLAVLAIMGMRHLVKNAMIV